MSHCLGLLVFQFKVNKVLYVTSDVYYLVYTVRLNNPKNDHFSDSTYGWEIVTCPIYILLFCCQKQMMAEVMDDLLRLRWQQRSFLRSILIMTFIFFCWARMTLLFRTIGGVEFCF